MFAYASRTGTKTTLELLRNAGWGLMLSPKGRLRTEGFSRYCLDNGAWHAYANSRLFDEDAFLDAYDRFAAEADFVVLPDIVAGGLRSLKFSLLWRERLPPRCPWLLAVQDGMHTSDIAGLVGPDLGIFVGGTSHWKETTLPAWGRIAKDCGAYLHVGRVNTARRIFLCRSVGADSFDGSGVSRFPGELELLESARQQLDMFT